MGLFKSKCVRCGSEMTRNKFEGLPTCETCELKMKMEREETRTCPVDGSNMQKMVVHNIIVDQCPKCNGYWLDEGELKLLQNAIQNSGNGDFASGFIAGMIIC